MVPRMDRWEAMRALVEVADRGSFSRAARQLGVSTATVSRQVAALEHHLGVELLTRTTRRVSPTDAGRICVERARYLIAELEQLERSLAFGKDRPSGHVRLTVGRAFGVRTLAPTLPRFLSEHPEVSVELVMTDRPVDLVREGFDLALRVGSVADAELIVRRVGTVSHHLCVGPGIAVDDLDQLLALPCLVSANQPRRWQLEGPERQRRAHDPRGPLRVDEVEPLVEACAAGLGVALLPSFAARPAVAAGRIREPLPQWQGPERGVHLVYPPSRQLSAAVRALVDFIAATLAHPPSR